MLVTVLDFSNIGLWGKFYWSKMMINNNLLELVCELNEFMRAVKLVITIQYSILVTVRWFTELFSQPPWYYDKSGYFRSVWLSLQNMFQIFWRYQSSWGWNYFCKMVVDKPTHILSSPLFILELVVKLRALFALSILSVAVYSLNPPVFF